MNTEYVIQESDRCREPSPKRGKPAGDTQIVRRSDVILID